jgi:F-type H+-transporting ATPase subunit b
MHFDLWTFALQTVNVVILIWLLARFFFRPIANIIAARVAAVEALISDAEVVRAKAEQEAAVVAQQQKDITADGERIVAAARSAAEGERASILHQADEAAAKFRGDAEQAIARDRQTMRESLERDAADLGLTIAVRLLERLPIQLLNQAFLEGLAETLATHPARASFCGTPIEVRSAAPLDATSQADCHAMLARFAGATPELSFRTDPTLVAGIELASSDVVIRNSWRADLERITRVLRETTNHDVATQHVA